MLPNTPPNPASGDPLRSGKIGVMIVDDHAVVRQGLRSFLEFPFVGETVGGARPKR